MMPQDGAERPSTVARDRDRGLLGGLACDRLVRPLGLAWSRRAVGLAGAVLSTGAMVAAALVTGHTAVIATLCLVYAGLALQQPMLFTACLDVGGARGGAVAGFMNTAGQLAGAASSVAFGYIVKATGSYGAPMVPMAVLLAVALVLWWGVDVRRRIGGGSGRIRYFPTGVSVTATT